jgi:hypothetical protein
MQILRFQLLVLIVLILYCTAEQNKASGWVCGTWLPPGGKQPCSSTVPGTRLSSTEQTFRHLEILQMTRKLFLLHVMNATQADSCGCS